MKKFCLNINVRLTKGIRRSIIFDLDRNIYIFVPNSLFDFVLNFNGKDLEYIFSQFNETEIIVVNEYLDWMVSLEFAIISCDPILFDYSTNNVYDWDLPYLITNCILEVDFENVELASKAMSIFFAYRIPYIELRVVGCVDIKVLYDFIKKFQNSPHKSLVIYLPYSSAFTLEQIRRYFDETTVLDLMVIFNSPIEQSFKIHNNLTPIIFIKEEIDNSSCGIISEKYFTINKIFYDESQQYNNCLNRKIAISKSGEIKNCPSFKKNFGNIMDTDLSDVLNNSEFKQLWKVSKSEIHVCRTCELRDICSDCRAYLVVPQDIKSKPLKCGYDPITNTWTDWESNPSHLKGIRYYKEETF